MRRIVTMVIIMILIITCTGCSKNNYAGTWYDLGRNPDDTNETLILSEDGNFVIYGDVGGEWSISDNRLLLINVWDTEQWGISDGYFVDEAGNFWTNNYEEAKDAYEKRIAEENAVRQQKIEKEQEERRSRIEYIKNNISGDY